MLQVITGYHIKNKFHSHCLHYYQIAIVHLKLRRMQDFAYWWQFLLDIVNISDILSHKIPKYNITNATYCDWPSTVLWLRNIFKQYFDYWIVLLKRKDGNFFKTEKKNSQHSKPGRDHTFITFTWKGCFQRETGIKICRMRADSFVFKQKIYCSVLQTEGVGESPNWSHFVAVNV